MYHKSSMFRYYNIIFARLYMVFEDNAIGHKSRFEKIPAVHDSSDDTCSNANQSIKIQTDFIPKCTFNINSFYAHGNNVKFCKTQNTTRIR